MENIYFSTQIISSCRYFGGLEVDLSVYNPLQLDILDLVFNNILIFDLVFFFR